MTYKRKQIPQQEPGESNRDYALRVIENQPIGYMNLFRKQLPHILAEFDSLPYETHGERLYNWLYPDGRRTCVQCGALTKFHNLSSGGYREFCNCSCRAKHFESNKNGLTPEAIAAKVRTRVARTVQQRVESERKRLSTLDKNGTNGNFERGLQEHRSQLMESYGVSHFNQRHYTPDTISKLNDEHWLRTEYHDKKRSVEDLRTDFNQAIGAAAIIASITKFNIPRHYVNHRSVGEREVESFVRSLGFDVEISNRTLIKPHELDIVVHSKFIAIEYCGLYWHSTANVRMTPSYHYDKMRAVQACGYRLVTIFEDEWKYSRFAVEQKLRAILGVSDQPIVYARKCDVCSPSKNDARNLLAVNHIQGPSRCSLTYGLRYNDELVAVMLMLRDGDGWDMVRYATSCRVIGGLGKLWAAFAREHPNTQVKTFADLRYYSMGGMYEALGFTLDGTIAPDYSYIVGDRREHKFNYRHSGKLSQMEGYDPLLSESENAELLGLYRIYNCGLLRYVKHT